MASLISRLQRIGQQIERFGKTVITKALGSLERQVVLTLFGLSLLLRLYQLDASLIGVTSAPFLGTTARVALSAAPWTTATSQLLLGLLTTVTQSLTFSLCTLIIINSLSIAALTHIVTRWFGLRSGALAGLFLCVNPWAIVSSRSIGPEALLIPCSLLVIWGLEIALAEDKPGGWILALAAAGLASGIDTIGLLLPIVCLIIVLVLNRRVSWKHVLVGLLWAILFATPPLHALNLSGWVSGRLSAGATSIADRWFSAVNALSGLGLTDLFAELPAVTLPTGLSITLEVWSWLCMAAVLGVWYLALWSWAHWRKRLDPAGFSVIALGSTLLLASAILLPIQDSPAMFGIVTPWVAVCMGLLIDALLPQLTFGKPARVCAGLLIILAVTIVGATQTSASLTMSDLATSQRAIDNTGMPLRYWHQTNEMVTRCVEQELADQVWLLEANEQPDLLVPDILTYMLPDIPFVRADAHTTPLPLAESTLALVSPDRSLASQNEAEVCGKVVIPGQPDALQMAKLTAVAPESLPIRDESKAVPIAPGITYIGYEAQQNGHEQRLIIYWRQAPDAASAAVSLYIESQFIGQLTPTFPAPMRCVSMATSLPIGLATGERALWAVTSNARIQLDSVTLQTSAE